MNNIVEKAQRHLDSDADKETLKHDIERLIGLVEAFEKHHGENYWYKKYVDIVEAISQQPTCQI
jgi:hypothetical protein